MMLQTYISDLLYRYDCVIVPEFGAFLSKRISAQINLENNSFFPPRKELSFNPQLQHNDGVLSNYISEIEKIPYSEAVRLIQKTVIEFNEILAEKKSLSFDAIGSISKSDEGQLQFEPNKATNYLTASFGLSEIISQTVSRTEHKEVVEAIEEKTPIALTTEKRKSSNWIKYAAAAVLILSIGGYSGLQIHKSNITSFNEVAQEKANKEIDTKVQEATFVISNPLPSINLNVEKQTGNFHIVAGAFRVEENSQKKVNQLKSLGYKARIIGKNRYGLHEVVYSSYKTRSEAQQALRNIRQTHNSEAWLLIKKLDK